MNPVSGNTVTPVAPRAPTPVDAQSLASGLLTAAATPQGTDVTRLRVGLDALATASPTVATAARDAIAARLSPTDAGALWRGADDGSSESFWDKIVDFIRGAIADVARAEGATFAPDVTGIASPADAPRTIKFTSGAQNIFQDLWNNSLPGGQPMEQGGTIVFDRETGVIGVTNLGGNSSTSGTFEADLSIDRPDQTGVLGVFHTHPYSEAEGGYTGVAFSGGDVAAMLTQGTTVEVVQSGDQQFMLMRTAQTPTDADPLAVQAGIEFRFQEFMNKGLDFGEASRMAVSEAAEIYHLAYYEGADGTLTRVNPK